MERKTSKILLAAVGSAYTVAVLLLAILRTLDLTIALTTIAVLVVFLVFGFIKRPPFHLQAPDERTRKVETLALAYSWLLTLYLVCVLYLLDHFKIVSIPDKSVLPIVFAFMVLSRYLLQLIVGKVGDKAE